MLKGFIVSIPKAAIVINLDYENTPAVKCKELFSLVEARMVHAGFDKRHRYFVTSMEPEAAYREARTVMDTIFNEFQSKGECVAHCFRDFYGIPFRQLVTLSTSSFNEIEVDVMETGTFQEFFPDKRCRVPFAIGKNLGQPIFGLMR
ncbi:MAG: hypothetical protein WCK63_01760 [Betaproteobacteria bacterium]